MRGIVLATVPQTFLFFPLTSPLSSLVSTPPLLHEGISRRRPTSWKIPAPECRRKFSFSTAFEGWTRGQREEEEGGEGRWTWNQRVERFSAEAAGWLLSDVVSFAIYSPRASPLVKVNNYADASAGRALLFAFFIFFFFLGGREESWKFFSSFSFITVFFFLFLAIIKW